jgi:hypothetical protein
MQSDPPLTLPSSLRPLRGEEILLSLNRGPNLDAVDGVRAPACLEFGRRGRRPSPRLLGRDAVPGVLFGPHLPRYRAVGWTDFDDEDDDENEDDFELPSAKEVSDAET